MEKLMDTKVHGDPAGALGKALRTRLREATAGAHAALEAEVGDIATLPAYRRYLEGLHRFRTAVEPGIAEACATLLPAARPSPIAAALAQDMRDLGMDPGPVDAVPAPADRDAAVGALYVLEGASLGARVLVRHAAALGLGATHGARHLALQCDPAGWRSFLAMLDAEPDIDIEAAAAAARHGFDQARHAFLQTAAVRHAVPG